MNRIAPLLRAAVALAAVTAIPACASRTDTPEPPAQAQPAAPAAQAEPAAQGQPRQPLSPRDTADIQVAGDRILVDYGRPYMRGRTIMGGLVPYGEVWRTGANAATTFVTRRNLRINGVDVPAGTYTLYTLPGEREWQLIVNRQTGQWGTEYNQEQDLARIPMRVERTPSPVEQFTIALEPAGGNVVNLVLTWENTRAWVPMELVGAGAS